MKEQQHKQKTWLLMENPNSLSHLTAAFDHHRGLCRGATGAAPIFEVHLKEHFLGGMNPDIAASVKISCISWKTISIQTIIFILHAEHEEDQIAVQDRNKKASVKISSTTPSLVCIKH